MNQRWSVFLIKQQTAALLKLHPSHMSTCRNRLLLQTQLKSFHILDIDECITRQSNCSNDVEMCKNTIGSYKCELLPCLFGFHRNEQKECEGKIGFIAS